ncbi:hypothetical protein Gpo141_00011290 [Globisporangium polare]
MKLSTILVVLAAVAASGARASDNTFAVGVPESITSSGSTTALGNPVHVSVEDIEGRTALGHPVSISSGSSALGVPVSVGHPVEERSASSTVGDVTPKTPQELALESIVKIYGVALPTPAPTTYVTPAPTSPTPAPTYTTPAPTVPTPAPTYTTPAPTAPTPAPTTPSSDSSVSDSNAAIKQVEIPAETPAATLATEAPTELLRDSEAAATTTTLAANDTTSEDSTSIAVPVAILGCVAAALAVAVVVLVQKKRAQKATVKTASPSNGEEVDYNNEMVTPV